LKHLPNYYINDIWKPKKIVQLARIFLSYTVEKILDLMYGVCSHPLTGETIPISEFGTAVHERIEEHVNAWLEGAELERDHPYDPWAYSAIQWMQKNNIEPISSELSVACHTSQTAGTIDLVAKKDGKVILADYKNRRLGAKLKAKAYEKDCCQLAIGAQVVKEQVGLDYDPETFTLCIDVETGKLVQKKWQHSTQMWGLRNFYACANLFHTYHNR
jgi:hypothetical protein